MVNSAFLDANILLEVLLERKKSAAAKQIMKTYANRAYISALTAHLVIYYGQKAIDLVTLRQFLGDYKIIDLKNEDFEWAFNNIHGQDFEDALQLGVAVRYGCDRFITLDQPLFNKYKGLRSIKLVLV